MSSPWLRPGLLKTYNILTELTALMFLKENIFNILTVMIHKFQLLRLSPQKGETVILKCTMKMGHYTCQGLPKSCLLVVDSTVMLRSEVMELIPLFAYFCKKFYHLKVTNFFQIF